MLEIGKINGSDNSTLLRMWSVEVPAGVRPLKQHSHIAFEISLFEKGSGTYTVGEKAYSFTAGDMFVFSSNEMHCITNVDDEGLQLINLHFEPRYIWGYSTDSLSYSNSDFCFTHDKKFKNKLSDKDISEMSALFRKIKQELSSGAVENGLVVKSLLNLMLVKLIRDFGYAKGDSGLDRERLHAVRRVIKEIDAHPEENFSLGSLSEIAGMTPNYFSAIFHRVSGMTLWQYIHSKRIDMALRMLHESDESILSIALTCGFNNTANFNKTFKKLTGMTPTEHRKTTDIMM